MGAKGFTLIELLVVVALMGLLIAISLAGWGGFRERKTLEAAGLEIAAQLEKARSRAINGEKPAECGTLDGYQVDESLVISPCCDNPDPEHDRNCYEVGEGETISDSLSIDLTSFTLVYDQFPVIFRVLSGAVDNQATITLTYHDLAGVITITPSGEISWEETAAVPGEPFE